MDPRPQLAGPYTRRVLWQRCPGGTSSLGLSVSAPARDFNGEDIVHTNRMRGTLEEQTEEQEEKRVKGYRAKG